MTTLVNNDPVLATSIEMFKKPLPKPVIVIPRLEYSDGVSVLDRYEAKEGLYEYRGYILETTQVTTSTASGDTEIQVTRWDGTLTNNGIFVNGWTGRLFFGSLLRNFLSYVEDRLQTW